MEVCACADAPFDVPCERPALPFLHGRGGGSADRNAYGNTDPITNADSNTNSYTVTNAYTVTKAHGYADPDTASYIHADADRHARPRFISECARRVR